MAKLTVEISDDMMEWLNGEVEQGRLTSLNSFARNALRKEREALDENYRYSDEDIGDMLIEARDSGIAPVETAEELFAEVMRRMEHHRNRVA